MENELNRRLLPDTDTLASSNIESIDRVVKYRYYCICDDNEYLHNTEHDAELHEMLLDKGYTEGSFNAVRTTNCTICDCKQYKKGRKEEIDYSTKDLVADDDIYGI